MLRRILGDSYGRKAPKSVHGPELDRALARLTIEPPNALWVALVRTNGLVMGCFPPEHATHRDRIAAMGAAMFSLGERISRELNSGDLRFTLVAGVAGLNLAIVLNKDYLLVLRLRSDMSMDAVFHGLRQSAAPLLNLLEVEDWVIDGNGSVCVAKCLGWRTREQFLGDTRST